MEKERSLAHIEEIKELQPLPGYDRVVLATILGWRCIVAKDDFKVGDKCIYFEIDSLVNPDDKRFAFMEKRKYKVKTQRMCKTMSQGLAMPLSAFPELGDPALGTDVTKELKVTYYNPEDRKRKSASNNPDAKYKSMCARHPSLFKKKPIRWLMKREWGKKLLFILFGRRKDNPKGFPSFVKKTDEERCENMPWILDDDRTYSVTEKLDGTSTTFSLEKKGRKWDFAVCSRNVRQLTPNQECYHDDNVYWEMAIKYDIEEKLIRFAEKYNIRQLYLQGETIGLKLQGNPYNMMSRDFFAFNMWVDGIRYNNKQLFEWCGNNGIKHVPYIYDGHKLPNTMDELKREAEGYSVLNPDVLREGLVYRADDDINFSWKNVANSYLMKKK